jgi:hypothetical protein
LAETQAKRASDYENRDPPGNPAGSTVIIVVVIIIAIVISRCLRGEWFTLVQTGGAVP